MTIKLQDYNHKVGELIVLGPYNVVRILSTPKLVCYAPHWKLLYLITGLEVFKEGFLYEIEKA